MPLSIAKSRLTAVFFALLPTTIVLAQTAASPDPEQAMLRDPVQLTFGDRFVKAGESYYSPDGSKIIFQAVELREGETPDDFYAMFVADTVRDDSGRTRALENIRRISPDGSANTCGWFHPLDDNLVIFGSTIESPLGKDAPGYQRGTGRYRWQFPPEMRIVSVELDRADATAAPLEHVVGDGDGYVAEGSFSPDGRHVLYTSLEAGQGDIYTKDLSTGVVTHLVSAPGYDGGPFFSPDGRRIVYRSDRHGNNLLQVFVADLKFDEAGTIVGVEAEHQVTDDEFVNWCPFWHPDGRHLVFSTSRMGHRNYEVFMVDARSDEVPGRPLRKYGTGLRRVTFGPSADVLPAFNHDGSEMIWTCKRGATGTSQLWAAEFVAPLRSPSLGSMPDRSGE